MKHHKLFLFPFLITFILFSSGCKTNLTMDKDISAYSYKLINQDSSTVIFPHKYQGKIVVIGFIFTNCPDICPFTTHNMQLIQERAKKEGVNNIQFAALSFDPDRDTPKILKQYAKARDIDLANFHFITGKKQTVDSLLKKMGVLAIPGDTTYTDSGEPIYFFTHTDRITLIDQDEHLRKEYKGSKVDVDAIINDIKELGD
ncbi:MAG: SCO family protein [Ignavibacteriaceae bacterium]|nr:SCO family protein [Ignavibacteriaceae bacterium]